MTELLVTVRIWVETEGYVKPVKHVFGPRSLSGAVHAALLAAKHRPIESWSIESDERLVSGRGRQGLEAASLSF